VGTTTQILDFPGKLTKRPVPALGQLDEWRFVDTLIRNIDPTGAAKIPKGSGIYMRGWALVPEPPRTARTVIGAVGHRLVFETLYGKPRPDIASYYGGSMLASCGFSTVQKLSALGVGSHELLVAALDNDGGYFEVARLPFEVVPSREMIAGKTRSSAGRVHVSIDTVSTLRNPNAFDGKTLRATAGDVVYVRGWAIDREARAGLAGVMGIFDDDEFVLGIHGLPRDDAAAAISIPRARRCGFTVRMPTQNMKMGGHSIDVAILAADGLSYVTHRIGRLELTST
jgi:hypothetical protein